MIHSLAQLDFAVVILALRDSAASLKGQHLLSQWVFGLRQSGLPLANPKLEALRRYVVVRRTYGSAPASETRGTLREAGYRPADLSEIDRLVDDLSRSRRKRRHLSFTTKMGNPMRQAFSISRRIILSTFLPLSCWSHGAAAQGQQSVETQTMVAGEGAEGPGGPGGPDGDHIAIGIGGMYQPNYMGAKKYQFQPLPAIDVKLGRFFANFQNGIGFAPIDNEVFTIGGGIVMATDNYSRKDVPGRFNRIKMGAGARGFVTVRQYGLEASAGLTQIFMGGTKGMIADFNLSRPIMVNERMFLNPSIGTRWANAKHNNRFYGVTAQQSTASGLQQFRPGSGLLDARAELGMQYRLTDRLSLGTIGGVATLLGNAKDSPIVRKKTAPYGLGFVTYSF